MTTLELPFTFLEGIFLEAHFILSESFLFKISKIHITLVFKAAEGDHPTIMCEHLLILKWPA